MNNYAKRLGLRPWQLWLGGLGIMGGIWLILAPFVLNYAGITRLAATTKKPVSVNLTAVIISDLICGVLLVTLVGFVLWSAKYVNLTKLRFYASIAVIAVGIYLIAAPYIFDLFKVAKYMDLDKPNTNDQLMGILTIILGGFALQTNFRSDEPVLDTRSKIVPLVLS